MNDGKLHIPCVAASLDIFRQISDSIGTPGMSTTAYVSGGIAIAYWLDGLRPANKLTAIFVPHLPLAQRFSSPLAAEANQADARADGQADGLVCLDVSFKNFFALLHSGYPSRAHCIRQFENITVFMLAPEDVILLNIATLSEDDMADIALLAKKGLLDRERIAQLAEEALTGYIGCRGNIRQNLKRVTDTIALHAL
ncbi:MAG: hypothetical protein Q4F27_00685 [Desulfovibrionaceae bacterium]|nr:hypothetical protein [Desulfovibrionaceae bacterium]